MDKFYEVSDDTISKFNEIFDKKSFTLSIHFQFIGSEKQKEFIKISKVPEQYFFIIKKEIIVSINEDLMHLFDDESITILMEQEIDKIYVDNESGKIKLIKPDLNTFSSLVSKYGVEKVSRANQICSLANEQKKDNDDDFII